MPSLSSPHITPFDRDFFNASLPFTYVGAGELGGKASGLATGAAIIAERLDQGHFPGITVSIPHLTVLTTALFDTFMQRNDLHEYASEDLPDDRIAHAFLKAELPTELVGDLRALVAEVHQPLAIRSSSLLEDAKGRPLAGVYATKMTPNNQPDVDARFRKLVEGIKLVWASTYFREAKSYRASLGVGDEKMAVIIQEIVGQRFGDRFYPHISGVGRSYNYYATGNARPEEGVGLLALGLGRTIVDGEPAWSFSPAYPKSPPPYNSIGDLLDTSQREFWAVTMASVPYDPTLETEYMVHPGLHEAEADGTLRFVASTFDPQSNRIVPTLYAQGPRLVNFAPILSSGVIPLNDALKALLTACEDHLGAPVEIEYAVSLDPEHGAPARLGFLQVRALAVGVEHVDVAEDELAGADVLLATDRALGNGVVETIRDIVYVKRDAFEPLVTLAIARELGALNATLLREEARYLLLGFGRWGTSDPTGGIPVNWGQISGARAIVEATLPNMRQEMSQGSHFFHNLTSLGVQYFSVSGRPGQRVDWDWLDAQTASSETPHLRHIRLAAPLLLKLDGRSGRGVVRRRG